MRLKICFLLTAAFACAAGAVSKEYTPWYTGPLLAPSANNLMPGQANVQPYLYVTDTYARYNANGHHSGITDIVATEWSQLNQFGLNDFLDVTLYLNIIYNHEKDINVVNFEDTKLMFGIQLFKEKEDFWVPTMRLTIAEIFPTGRYQKLNPSKNGLDSSGSGSYDTMIGLNMSKIVYWIKSHPMRFRLTNSYTLPSLAHVQGFNAFGGSYDTYGKVRPSQTYNGDFSIEFSFTQRWVYAMDLAYSYATKSKFSGYPGISEDGSFASNSSPSSYQWSLAPALEYNINADLGFIGGVWFSFAGRNSDDFISGSISVTYTF